MLTRYLTLLLAFFLPLLAHAQKDAAEPRYGHEFPTMFALEEDWVDLKRDPLPLKAIQALLDKDADGSHVVSPSDITHSSAWTAVDRWLKQHPDVVAALRKEQDAAAPAKLFVAKRTGDMARLMAVYRSYPWADAVHQSLIGTADQMLRNGNAQLALRCFQDVLERSEVAELRAHAQAGIWLAAAHAADSAEDINALFRDADTSARYPWFGQQLSAKEIEAQLIAGIKPATPLPALDALSVRTIQLPDDPPWMGWTGHLNPTTHELFFRHKLRPVVSEKGTVVAGPCPRRYAGDSLDKPEWSKIATMDMHKNRGGIPPKPPFDPLVVGGRIYVRCGKDIAPAGEKRTHFIRMNHHAALNFDFLEYIAAFDQDTGKRIWSTKDAAGWRNLFPVNAPIYHDGRLYSLAMLRKAVKIHGWNDGGQILIGGRAPIFLVISDAETGSVLRQQELFAYHTNFKAYNPSPDKTNAVPPPETKPLDLAADASQRAPVVHHTQPSVYGDRLTMHDGAVYISTVMGAVARCDARDGLIEWVSTYPQLSPHLHNAAAICRRHGLPPLVSDRVVVISPRDSVAIFAVDRETGAPLWQKTQIEDIADGDPAAASEEPVAGPADGQLLDGSLEVLGLFGDLVLVTFDHQIAALEAATGKVRWTRELKAPVERPTKVEGTTLYVATAMDLFKIDGAKGEILATRAFAPLRSDNGFVWDDKGLIIVNPGKHGITSYVDFEAGRDPFAEPNS